MNSRARSQLSPSSFIHLGSVLALLALAGCSGEPSNGDDSGVTSDVGMDARPTRDDAGAEIDAGAENDVGTENDAGTDNDAGALADNDAGTENDGGSDAGDPDVGSDAGPIDYCVKLAVVCADPGPCMTVRCDPATADCIATPRADGASCEDGNLCTRVGMCTAGVCVGSSPVTCPAPENPCLATECIPSTGLCSTPSVRPNGASCTAGTCGSGNCAVCRTGVCTPSRLRCTGGPCSCGALDQPICETGHACAEGLGFAFGAPDATCFCIPGMTC